MFSFPSRAAPSLSLLSLSFSFLSPFVHHTKQRLLHHLRALTVAPHTPPPFTNPFCFLRREISTHSTRTGRQVRISSIPGGPRSRATPRRRRALMLSYMICLTSSRRISRLLVPAFFSFFPSACTRAKSGSRNFTTSRATNFPERREAISRLSSRFPQDCTWGKNY